MKKRTLAAIITAALTIQSFAGIVSADTKAAFSGNDGGGLFNFKRNGTNQSVENKDKVQSNLTETNSTGLSLSEKKRNERLDKLKQDYNDQMESLRLQKDERYAAIEGDPNLNEEERQNAYDIADAMFTEQERLIKESYNHETDRIEQERIAELNEKYGEGNWDYTESTGTNTKKDPFSAESWYSYENMKKQAEANLKASENDANKQALAYYLSQEAKNKSASDGGTSLEIDYGDYKVYLTDTGKGSLVGKNSNGDEMTYEFSLDTEGNIVGDVDCKVNSNRQGEVTGESHTESDSANNGNGVLGLPGLGVPDTGVVASGTGSST